jgi:membrane-associated phospholipid phosphatase
MIALLKKNSAFFIPYSVFVLCGGVLLLCFTKHSIALYVNSYHCTTADFFFKYWTLIGLGWLMVPVGLVLLFVRLRYFIIASLSFIIAFLVNDTIKQIVGAPRPIEMFSQLHQDLYLIPGVEVNHWNSFPSGHTVIAFALLSSLALFTTSKTMKFVFFITAFLVAYSRMYLSQHFLIDVYVASFIGVCSTLLSYRLGTNLSWLNKFSAMDKPVIHLKKTEQ